MTVVPSLLEAGTGCREDSFSADKDGGGWSCEQWGTVAAWELGTPAVWNYVHFRGCGDYFLSQAREVFSYYGLKFSGSFSVSFSSGPL